MSIYDYTASLVITFDKPIVTEAPSVAGWLTTGYEPIMSPGGSLILKTYSIKRVERVDSLTIRIWLNLSGRMRYPQGNITVAYSKATGNLSGAYNSQVEDFTLTFAPTGIVPVFNPHDPENITLSPSATAILYTLTYSYYKSGEENITLSATGAATLLDINGLPI